MDQCLLIVIYKNNSSVEWVFRIINPVKESEACPFWPQLRMNWGRLIAYVKPEY